MDPGPSRMVDAVGRNRLPPLRKERETHWQVPMEPTNWLPPPCRIGPVTVFCDRRSRLPLVVGLTPLHCVAGCPRTDLSSRSTTPARPVLLFAASAAGSPSRNVKMILCSAASAWETWQRDNRCAAGSEKPLGGPQFVAAAHTGPLFCSSAIEAHNAAEPVGAHGSSFWKHASARSRSRVTIPSRLCRLVPAGHVGCKLRLQPKAAVGNCVHPNRPYALRGRACV